MSSTETTPEGSSPDRSEENALADYAYYASRRVRGLVLAGFAGILSGGFGVVIASIRPEVFDRFNIRPELMGLWGPITAFLGLSITLYAFVLYYLSFGVTSPAKIGERYLRTAGPRSHNNAALTSRTDLEMAGPRPRVIPIIDRSRRIENSLVSRLRTEIRQQARRADTNLAAGTIAAVLGILILIWLSLDAANRISAISQANNPSTEQLGIATAYWGSFLSRMLISVTCNIFSFFFLSTYRRSLSEVRYFQNELTNVQSKMLAIALSSDASVKTVRSSIIKALSEVERNFVLRKGETTADLGLKDLDRQEVEKLSTILGGAVASAMREKTEKSAK